MCEGEEVVDGWEVMFGRRKCEAQEKNSEAQNEEEGIEIVWGAGGRER